MKIFNIYQNNNNDIILVSEGFNFFAACFKVFWAIYNRLSILTLIGVIFLFLAYINTIGYPIEITSLLFFGFLSPYFHEIEIQKKGYELVDIVYAKDKYSAELKHFKRKQSA